MGATIADVEVCASDVERIPRTNLRVPRDEFVAVWRAAERWHPAHRDDWYCAAVIVTCRWLAHVTETPAVGPWSPAISPVTMRTERAYEELIEQECLEADNLAYTRPAWLVEHEPGWIEGVVVTLNWVWRRQGDPPFPRGFDSP